MRPVTTIDQVFEAMQRARTGASAFCTNLFPDRVRLQGWVDHGELLNCAGDGTTLFLRRDRDFHHLYYCAPSFASLQAALAGFPELAEQRVSVDLIGAEDALGESQTVLRECGFRPRARLVRLVRGLQEPVSPAAAVTAEVTQALPSDCAAILALLEQGFDRYVDQLPTPYEMEAAIAASQVWLIKSADQLAALLHFEVQGLTSTVRYWAVDPRFRALRYGAALIRHYFAAHPRVRRFILWVRADNEDALAKYRHYGYAPDGLVDHVLINAAFSQ